MIAVDAPTSLSVAGFRNPDGTLGVFGHNGSSSPQVVAIGERAYPVAPGEMFSWRG